jgi:uncharacterized membrane protein YgcG
MLKRSLLAPAIVAVSLFAGSAALTPVYAAGAEATIHEVYQAAEAGRFADAHAMMNKVLQDNPNSAKAHYVEADLYGKEGNMRDAQTELNIAERLDPSLKFAKPGRVEELQGIISGSSHTMQRSQPIVQRQYQQPSSGTSGLVWIVLIVAGIVLFIMVRAMTRRTAIIANGGYPAGYAPGGMPTYGPGGMPSYGPGGGMGSGILGGLATGAAVGAGIVAGEELMHHFTDHDRGDEYRREEYRQDDSSTRQDDMGGNDFGVSDSSSWDSGGGGGGGGSDDW